MQRLRRLHHETACDRLLATAPGSTMLSTHHRQMTVDALVSLHQHRRLNLSPAFQRQSVWGKRDRQLLIESLLDGVPIPSVYLYRQSGRRGALKYDVIDGKQRIETILYFMGRGPLASDDSLVIRTSFDEGEAPDWWSWWDLRTEHQNRIQATNIPIIEVEGELNEIIDLFVRINSTGKRLTGHEKRNARYFESPIMKTGQRLGEAHHDYLLSNGVVSAGQARRMKHVELLVELLLAIHKDRHLNKKEEVDRVIRGESPTQTELQEAARKLNRALRLLQAVLPDLKTTRFRRGSDFYTLVLLLHRYAEDGVPLRAGRSGENHLAGALLRDFGRGVDELIESRRSGGGGTAALKPSEEYLQTVRSDTDSAKTRKKRERVLDQVLEHVFERDAQRLFNATQRRITWHASAHKTCSFCDEPIRRWEDMAVDHVRPHSRGGRTHLSNAALAHRRCNSAAGAKRSG